jgi:hypothetical protein
LQAEGSVLGIPSEQKELPIAGLSSSKESKVKSVFANWLRHLDAAMEQESALCDLYQHHATAGKVREFLVHGLLRRFLPAIVSIETGKVIDFHGTLSKQVDILLFDARVPCLRGPDGTGLFPVEGVLAAIEVKTRIHSADDLVCALENCHSVSALQATGDWDFQNAIERKIGEHIARENMSRLDAYVLAMNCAFPATYVFALQDGLSDEGLCDAIDQWFHRPRAPNLKETTPAIPRMIVAGHRVAVANDRIARFPTSAEAHEHAVQLFGPTGEVLAGIWPRVEHRWSWLASHLLLSLTYRLGITHDYLGARYRIDRYLPFDECFQLENQEGVMVQHVLWKGYTSTSTQQD